MGQCFCFFVWFGNPFDPNTISLIDEYAYYDLTNPYVQTWHVLEISSTLVVTYIGPRWLNSNLYRTRETNSSQKFNYANLIPWLLKIYLRDTGSISVQQNMPCDIVIWGGSQNNKAHKNRQISMQLANSNRPTYPFNSTRRGRVAFLGNTKFHVSLLLLLWDSLNC